MGEWASILPHVISWVGSWSSRTRIVEWPLCGAFEPHAGAFEVETKIESCGSAPLAVTLRSGARETACAPRARQLPNHEATM
jgi:hypothetical protein